MSPRVDFIDVSEHQGPIDWAAVPVRAIVKATEGSTFTDRRFSENADGAGMVRKLLGVYHFLTSTSPGDRQARHFVGTVRGELIDPDPSLVWVLDWETDTIGRRPDLETAQAFLDQLRALVPGAQVWLYANAWGASWAQSNGLPFWVAAYPNPGHEDAAERSMRELGAIAWQWSSSGAVDGIAGRVDVNQLLLPDLTNQPPMEGQTMTDTEAQQLRSQLGLDAVPTRDYADDGTFTETAPLPTAQLAANAHIEAQLASLAADRAVKAAEHAAQLVQQLIDQLNAGGLSIAVHVDPKALADAMRDAARQVLA